MYVFYAKSNGETIEEHTAKALCVFKKLDSYVKLSSEEKSIIEKIIYYHDSGKVNPEFQNRMRKRLCIKNSFKWGKGRIPHEWLSPAFITEREENEIKEKLEKLGLDKERFFNFVIFTILAHHNRENQVPDNDLICDNIQWIRDNYNSEVYYYYDVYNILRIYNNSENRKEWNLFFPYRVRWLGSLLKCDYCASGGIEVEESYSGNYADDLLRFFNRKGFEIKDFQKSAGSQSKRNVVLIASTGMGKTEAAMKWINGQKAFYLLSIRVSVNEMYKRFKDVFGDNVSLLHGETSYFFAQIEQYEDEYEAKIEKSRKLSYPLTVATADQLVTSVFKYPGFEFTYLTCSYSKIVLDEIQSFAPSSIAAVVVFLKEVYKLGGRFMLMTATLPPFLLEEFKSWGSDVFIFEPQLLNIMRHKIAIVENMIESEILQKIINKNKDKRILIICNTIKMAQRIYNQLKDFNPGLIHSHFIGKDRREKEESIMKAHKSNQSCIWISTQIVETSLDIDFDLLLTENSSIESLFQRFGRCYRNREYMANEPNIYIFKAKQYNIYDSYLFIKTWDVIQKYNHKFISETDKQDMINEVFKNIYNTKYFEEYKRQKDLLEIGYRSLSKIEAQKDFRQITNNYIIIPEDVFEINKENITSIIQFIDDKNNNRLERIKKQAELMDYSMPIQLYGDIVKKVKDIPNSKFCQNHRIKLLKDCKYTKELGLSGNSIEVEEAEPDNIV